MTTEEIKKFSKEDLYVIAGIVFVLGLLFGSAWGSHKQYKYLDGGVEDCMNNRFYDKSDLIDCINDAFIPPEGPPSDL